MKIKFIFLKQTNLFIHVDHYILDVTDISLLKSKFRAQQILLFFSIAFHE